MEWDDKVIAILAGRSTCCLLSYLLPYPQYKPELCGLMFKSANSGPTRKKTTTATAKKCRYFVLLHLGMVLQHLQVKQNNIRSI